MNRRSFLTRAAVAAAAFAVDPGELLWTPGKKTFFLPPEKPKVRVYGLKELPPQTFTLAGLNSVYTVPTGLGRAVFDQDWNLMTLAGRELTPIEAARAQSANYTVMGPRHTPQQLREHAIEIEARRVLAGWHKG